MNEDLTSIFKRLKKLLAMSQDKSSPAEAANAAAMAENIMRKYQIEHSDIIMKDLEKGESFGKVDVGSTLDQSKMKVENVDRNLSRLCVRIAILNDAQAIVIKDEHFGKMFRFRGYKPDVEICKFMFRYIIKHLQISCKQHLDYSADFKVGFITAVNEILKKAKEDKDREGVTNSASSALVVVKGNLVTQQFGDPGYVASSVSISNSESADRGYKVGKSMDVLRRGVTTKESTCLKLS